MIDLLNSMDFPALFPRSAVGRLTGGVLHPKTLANLDSAGKGPGKRWRVGRRVFYERDSFVEWLASRVQVPERKVSESDGQAPISRSAEALGYLAHSFDAR